MKKILISIVLIIAIVVILITVTNKNRIENITINNNVIAVEIADTLKSRQKGLTFREDIPFGTGMLFIFEDSSKKIFTMKNTKVSLDIAWISPEKEIIDITYGMVPETEMLYFSPDNIMYALEVPKGYFASSNIEKGQKVIFPDTL